MYSTARVNTVVEAINVTMEIYGKPVRAVITREVLEALWGVSTKRPDSMLESFRRHQRAIETTIIDQYLRERRDPVVVTPLMPMEH
jgi:hypothetical protein